MFSDQYSICCFEVDLIKQFLALLNRFSYFCDSLDFLCFVGVSLYARNKKIQNIQKLVGSSGLEPPTSRLSGVRSNHLSYEPMLLSSVCLSYLSLFLSEVVEMNGIEPMTPCLQRRCSPSWATPPCLSCTSKIKQRFLRALFDLSDLGC